VLGVANLPYVTVKVCTPGSTTQCATVDHVFLDTGSYGLRLLRSKVAGLSLTPIQVSGGTVVECYPFVIGGVWGPLAKVDLTIGGEQASSLPIQIIDDSDPAQFKPTTDCDAAANNQLLTSAGALQANGVLGIGMVRYDCGLPCDQGDYTGRPIVYYRCSSATNCTATALPAAEQVQNPVSAFAADNNGTIVAMPAVPDTGASLVRGRLVFGIGTQSNNQLTAGLTTLYVETDPQSPNYLYLSTQIGSLSYAASYVDSGTNGLFFADGALSSNCKAGGAGDAWYCPPTTVTRNALLTDGIGHSVTLSLSVANADVLFATANVAFGNLGGTTAAGTFVWGMPFFYGRRVHTAIWGQALAVNGPWVGF
jgi:hypothetical protein